MSEKVAEGLQISSHPHICGGQACVSGRRIPTRIIAGRFIAGEDIKFIASDYELTRLAVEQAIRYELCVARRLKKRAAKMVNNGIL